MIRAMIKNGVIQPLEPLPPNWQEGYEVVVADRDEEHRGGVETIDQWAEDMNALTAGLNDPLTWQAIESALADADHQSKNMVRQEMDLR